MSSEAFFRDLILMICVGVVVAAATQVFAQEEGLECRVEDLSDELAQLSCPLRAGSVLWVHTYLSDLEGVPLVGESIRLRGEE